MQITQWMAMMFTFTISRKYLTRHQNKMIFTKPWSSQQFNLSFKKESMRVFSLMVKQAPVKRTPSTDPTKSHRNQWIKWHLKKLKSIKVLAWLNAQLWMSFINWVKAMIQKSIRANSNMLKRKNNKMIARFKRYKIMAMKTFRTLKLQSMKLSHQFKFLYPFIKFTMKM